MKKIHLLTFLFVSTLLPAQTIYTSEKNFRGHLQGIIADETGIYCSFAHDMLKVDFNGNMLRRFPVPSHAGDMTSDGENIYCAISLWNQQYAEKHGSANCIFVFDKEFKLKEVKPLKDLKGIDGIAYINGKFYIGINELSSRLRPENKIAILDKNFKLLKIATVTIGVKTKFGAQTLNNFNGKLLASFYGGGDNSFVFDPAELESSDKTVKPVDSFPADTTVGFTMLPETVAEPGTFIVARNFRTTEPVSKKRRYGAKFLVQKLDASGKLKKAVLSK